MQRTSQARLEEAQRLPHGPLSYVWTPGPRPSRANQSHGEGGCPGHCPSEGHSWQSDIIVRWVSEQNRSGSSPAAPAERRAVPAESWPNCQFVSKINVAGLSQLLLGHFFKAAEEKRSIRLEVSTTSFASMTLRSLSLPTFERPNSILHQLYYMGSTFQVPRVRKHGLY